jgi:type IV pilus assembly protein PilQ
LVPTEGVLPVNSTQGATYGDALVDLATTGAAAASGGYAGFTLLKAGDYLLDLELSAAQRNNRSDLLSNPRLVTADQTKAQIKQGVQIPYQITQAASTGGGLPVQNVAFKDAVLELNVTPHITPDDNILMELLIKKDIPGEVQTNGNRAINTRQIETTAQVGNGETVVLGGVFESDNINTTDKVPFFGDLPGVGYFFRRDHVEDNKRELLIFITPKVLRESIAAAGLESVR